MSGPSAARPPEAAPRRPRRFRSARRLPAALVALVVLAVTGLFLYDLAAVRAHRPGMQWRRELGRQLERHTPADAAVIAAAAALAAAGLLLLLLALTPGRGGLLAMASPAPAVRAGIGRKSAELLLRDRAMEVPGVRSVRVAVRRRHVVVRAASHFRELDDVRADLDAVLAVGLAELGLVRDLPVRVRVTRPAGKG
ncbi:DUF6286 domain-containing protein [Streptomyces antimicrobicus]|uniref:DUF6286 domain-containing protein n=1 Tax=Streptomyces antimicrobicus TaxID=2883108 RepID=A0ABS8B9K0_9ACTN|nr:DUF6286 domain-containing protein [Streptomyces antimicrobicus]MCB5181216.1 DUF6286 domain-containing protein [Streptomyces antimicrobicus]